MSLSFTCRPLTVREPDALPACVITDMAIMGFDEQSRKMVLRGCFAGIAKETVLDNMGFSVDTSRAETIPPPSAEELAILREKCDPQRLILG